MANSLEIVNWIEVIINPDKNTDYFYFVIEKAEKIVALQNTVNFSKIKFFRYYFEQLRSEHMIFWSWNPYWFSALQVNFSAWENMSEFEILSVSYSEKLAKCYSFGNY